MTSAEVRRILIVEDEPSVMSAHARFVESLGYEVERAADGFEALSKLALGIDLVLLDISMPGMDGFEVATRIRALREHAFTPIVMVTGLDRETWYPRALEVGANDVIAKPINAQELRLRTRWLMELKSARDELERRGQRLSEAVERKTSDLRAALEETSRAERRIFEAHLDTIRRLTVAAEYKDENTAGHIARVGLSAAILARAVGFPPGRLDMIRHAAQMHDVGKIGTPDSILQKPGRLTDSETAVMREHTVRGGEIAQRVRALSPVAASVRAHHEHFDGRGYPDALRGADIPLAARIVAVADTYDAMTSARPYRPALGHEEAVAEIRRVRGTQLDPRCVDAFLTLFDKGRLVAA